MDERQTLEQRLVDPAPMSATALVDLTLAALDHGLFEAIVARIEWAISQGRDDARLHQILGLARRELLDAAGATMAFERAAALAPHDAKIAHGLARSAWEAGFPAVALYDKALRLAPSEAGVLTDRAAALAAEARGAEAEIALSETLTQNPGWREGHAAYAQIVAASRSRNDGTSTVRAALARYPSDPWLSRLLLRLLLDARRYDEVVMLARDFAVRIGQDDEWLRAEAIALSEQGKAEAAQSVFDRLLPSDVAVGLVYPLRNLIRLGRFDEAQHLAERSFPMSEESVLWPYRALLWRLTGDERWHWLEGDPRLIGIYDLGMSTVQIDDLAEMLRALHRRSGELTDQSVRGGTQTDGNLLARAEPEIRLLHAALSAAIAQHIAQLPPPVAGHPTLVERRAPARIAGSWSVRLSGAGFHVDHVHSMGWLSSAFYVALPKADGMSGQEGWLAFGEARDLLPALDGFRLVEPEAGKLVLFPSTMWHGTRPFSSGERVTVAFDVARP